NRPFISDCPGSIRRGSRLCALFFSYGTGWRTRTAITISGALVQLDRLGSGTVIVVQHAAQALPALDLSRASEVGGLWTDELVLQQHGATMTSWACIGHNQPVAETWWFRSP